MKVTRSTSYIALEDFSVNILIRNCPALFCSYVEGTTTYLPFFKSNLFTTSRALMKIESPAFSNIVCKRYFLFSSTYIEIRNCKQRSYEPDKWTNRYRQTVLNDLKTDKHSLKNKVTRQTDLQGQTIYCCRLNTVLGR